TSACSVVPGCGAYVKFVLRLNCWSGFREISPAPAIIVP
ncbi:unnamed protein product, partial [Tenebrio molitor]